MGKSLIHHKFKTIGVQSCLAPLKAYTTNAKLKRTIRVLINNYKNLHITTTLDKKGRSPNLIREIGTKANLKTRPSKIILIYDDLKIPYAPQLNLATAKFIAITISEDQMTNLSREVKEVKQTKHINKTCTITDIKNTDQDPMMEIILGRQKILIAQGQDANYCT